MLVVLPELINFWNSTSSIKIRKSQSQNILNIQFFLLKEKTH